MTTNTPSYGHMNDTQLSSFSAGLIFGVDKRALHRYTQWCLYQYEVHLHFAVCHDIWVVILHHPPHHHHHGGMIPDSVESPSTACYETIHHCPMPKDMHTRFPFSHVLVGQVALCAMHIGVCV